MPRDLKNIRQAVLLGIGLLCIVLTLILWFTDEVQPHLLDFLVDPPLQIAQLETRYLYGLLMAFSFFPVFLLSFDRQVAYYRQWKYLFPAIFLMAFPFIIWDVWYTRVGVWGFNEAYFSGLRILGLPIEEWLFFLVIPFACVFIYENVRVKARRDWYIRIEPWVSAGLLLFFVIAGFFAWGRIYSASSYIMSAGLLAFHMAYGNALIRARFFLAFYWSLIPFLIIDGVLTGIATKAPIVVYNPDEFLGWRIWTIPVDDAVYGMLLLFGVVILMERFRQVKK
ncbi:MAG: lycopene cyclase domain-containing protein [Saprospiraceae bacterium]|nr:lycopene cyclase domain-containing protein [Saprospiraceae bacterium]